MTDPHSVHAWVLANPFRAHVRHLIDSTGLPWPAIAIEAGVSTTFLHHLLFGRRGRPIPRIPQDVAECLLSLQATDLHQTMARRVPAARTASRVSALLAAGHDAVRLAQFCRLADFELRALPGAPRCSRLTEVLVEAACQLSAGSSARLSRAA